MQQNIITRPKRALSDQFNVDLEAVAKLEQDLTEKYNVILGIQVAEKKQIQKKISPEMELMAKLEQEFGITIDQKRKYSDQGEEYNQDLQVLKSHPPGINIKLNIGTPKIETPSKLPYILDENSQIHKGKLKFFDESKKYGFLLLDEDNTDVFVHLDDIQNAGITVEKLRAFSQLQINGPIINFAKNLNIAPYFEFTLMNYIGKYNKSRKAVELKLLS